MFCIPLMNKVITVLEIASFACDYVYSVCFPFICVAAETASLQLCPSVSTPEL